MSKLRQYFSKALEEFRYSVVSIFTFVMIFGLKALLFREIPELLNHYSVASLRVVMFDILIVVSSTLILGRKKMGVWLWIIAISINIILMCNDKGLSGFDKSFIVGIVLHLFILVWCMFLKKDGKTAWSVLK